LRTCAITPWFENLSKRFLLCALTKIPTSGFHFRGSVARPISWLPRLDAIRQSVGASVRSHYDSDIQRLFEIQTRSAQLLLEQLPTVRIGKSLLVERETLAAYLDRLASSEEPAPVRRKLRVLVQKDADVTGLPPNVNLQRGMLTLRFGTVEELAGSLMMLGQSE
jgi:hypothetical protein